jgi:hypothetical protein
MMLVRPYAVKARWIPSAASANDAITALLRLTTIAQSALEKPVIIPTQKRPIVAGTSQTM